MGKDDIRVKGKCHNESIMHGVKGEKLHWSKVNFRLGKPFALLSVWLGCLRRLVVAPWWQHSKNKFDEHLLEMGWS